MSLLVMASAPTPPPLGERRITTLFVPGENGKCKFRKAVEFHLSDGSEVRIEAKSRCEFPMDAKELMRSI